jgi:hypothetical protein
MPDDDGAGAGVFQHFGRQVAGEGAGRLGVAVLAADADRTALRRRGELGNQRCRRAYHEVDRGEAARAGDDLAQLHRRPRKAIHLPVARHQRASRRASHGLFSTVSRVPPSG